MRVLVTGGAGCIGSHVMDALVAGGHAVGVIDDLSTGRADFVNAGAEFLRTNIGSRDAASFVKAWKPDALAHLAAKVSVRDSVADPVNDAQTNVLGSLALLEACRRAGTKQVVFSSTGGAMYGLAKRLPTPESEAPTPLSPYGCAKLAVEGYLGYFARVHGVRTREYRARHIRRRHIRRNFATGRVADGAWVQRSPMGSLGRPTVATNGPASRIQSCDERACLPYSSCDERACLPYSASRIRCAVKPTASLHRHGDRGSATRGSG